MLFENIHIHSLNLLTFVDNVSSDVETTLENDKLAILEPLELYFFLALSQPYWWWWWDGKFFSGKFPVFYRNKNKC